MTAPPPRVARTLEEANGIIAALWAEVHALRQEVAVLKARLLQNSTNSSRPPSSDPPWRGKRKPPEARSGRKPGGQPGHEGHAREAVPPEQVDKTVDVYPERCAICGGRTRAKRPAHVPEEAFGPRLKAVVAAP